MELLKLLNGSLMFAHAVSFLLLLWLLKKFMWKPILSALDARQDRIAAELNAIEDTKADVAKLKGEYQVFLAKVDELTRERIKEAHARGEADAQKMREHARQEAEQIVDEAKQEIVHELSRSKDLLRNEIVGMVVKATEMMLQEKLTFENDQKIIEDMLVELGKPDAK